MDILGTELNQNILGTGQSDVLQSVIDLLPNPVSIKNGRLERIAVNQAFVELTGYSAERLLGESKLDIQHAKTKKPGGCDEKVLRTKASTHHIENILNKNGDSRWVEITKNYFQANDGEDHVISVLTDITDLKAKEFELRASKELEIKKARLRSRFLADMGHDIRRPLNGITGMASVLAGTKLNPQQTEAVALLTRSGESLLRIIDDIIDFAKIDAAVMQIDQSPFNLRDFIEEFAETLGMTARDNRLDLIVAISPSLPETLIGDTFRIRQILMNLIDNALKFTEDGYVSLGVTGQVKDNVANIEFAVKDTGIGIPDGKMKTLFGSFENGEDTERVKGISGLGVSLCQKIAHLMGGRLEAGSVQGIGSEFILKLRLKIGAESETYTAGQALLQGANVVAQKILFVDDIKENYDAVLPHLSAHGLTADYAQSAAHAVQLLNNASRSGMPYSLIFIDYIMPVNDGLLLTTSLRDSRNHAHMNIVALSSVNDAEIRECFDSQNVLDYLTKPVRKSDIDQLLSKLSHEGMRQAS